MDEGFEKERFVTFKLKSSVAKKFRKFCKHYGKSQSLSLLDMILFFEINEIRPSERFGETITSLKFLMKKRFNALIAIIKSIEKHQTEPTAYLIKRLFEVSAQQENEEQLDFTPEELITENEELEYYKKQFRDSQKRYNELKADTQLMLKKLKYVRNNFGIGHYRLNLNKEEVERIKNHMDYVHHNNSSETR
ncbi:BfmA/BtgA family mobilization protein [Tamlana sp. 1_MG-2023]|uniref:BfmA/BtgA family mobilization protein n=1 Tax=Tamlana sp. 1_MG-2023 TaxID=3062628 RepID=UPI0026E1B3E5|nr:BfmA/BtgA family mobilization protein [Tamlana sp. 1_MG-2023]MDO6792447.1 BfmA/BtgA family mobilization protein [Tamlana sp. 1_MG-2023]